MGASRGVMYSGQQYAMDQGSVRSGDKLHDEKYF